MNVYATNVAMIRAVSSYAFNFLGLPLPLFLLVSGGVGTSPCSSEGGGVCPSLTTSVGPSSSTGDAALGLPLGLPGVPFGLPLLPLAEYEVHVYDNNMELFYIKPTVIWVHKYLSKYC